jgi:hypothetical protein
MRYLVVGALALLVSTPALWAQDPPKQKPPPGQPSPAAGQYETLVKEFQKAAQEFSKAYRDAKTEDDRKKVFRDLYPTLQKFPARFLELAQKNSKDPVAVDALVWIVVNTEGGPEMAQAIDLLVQDHLTSPKLGPVCQQLGQAPLQLTEKLLRGIWEKNPNREIKALACLSLAQALKSQSDRASSADAKKQAAEAEKLFDEVVTKYGDVKTDQGTLADLAKPELFEIRNLAIGKVAPEISGEDSDGKKFKLSDYRGKVVVLDFWAKW